jgi:hypothetical protein
MSCDEFCPPFPLFVLVACLAVGSASAADADAQRAAMTFFEKDVRPILVKRCFECHSNTKQKGGLRVDHIGYLKRAATRGRRWCRGSASKSPLMEAIRWTNEDFQMPPKNNGGKMPDAEIACSKSGSRWALRGLKMPRRRWW